MVNTIEGYLGKRTDCKKSRLPALWDKLQSLTGLILACFIICHIFFTSSILLGKGAFNSVVNFAEAEFIFGNGGLAWITNVVAGVIFIIFITHAFLGMRKFPANFKQYLLFRGHKTRMRHFDTTAWWLQFLTGFGLFFAASAHLMDILFNNKKITADISAANFHQYEIFYFVLLVFMVVHAGIGMYRLYVKWISIEGANKAEMTAKRASIRTLILGFWAALFVLALIADFVWIAQ